MTLPEREQIEQALLELKGVEGARVCLDEEGITEIHVAAAPGSRAKNVARDVRSYLIAALGIDVHHRKISVAVRQSAAPRQGLGEEDLAERGGPRVQFRSVNILVEGLRCEVQVELLSEGRVLVGTATGVPASLGTERLVVAACVDALSRLVPQEVRLLAGDLVFARIGAGEVIVVEVMLIRPRSEQRLIGACPVGQDRFRSIVFAVLDGLNRVLGGLSPGHWVEYSIDADESSDVGGGA